MTERRIQVDMSCVQCPESFAEAVAEALLEEVTGERLQAVIEMLPDGGCEVVLRNDLDEGDGDSVDDQEPQA